MMKRILASIVMVVMGAMLAWGQAIPVYDQASDIQTDVNDFGNNITVNATDVQKALKEINDLDIGGDSGWTSSTGIVTLTTGTDNVGIGSTVPRGKLDVAGDAYVNTLYYSSLSPSVSEADTLATVTARGAVTSTNVGIGSTATPTNALKVTGNADFTGNVGIGTSVATDTLFINSANGITLAGSGTVSGNVSTYPPAYSGTYVKATSTNGGSYYPHLSTDPAQPLTGSWSTVQWVSADNAYTNQRFHIDLGSAKVVNKIYYENAHTNGTNTNFGVKDFTFWGSNDGSSFSELTYATDTGWTQLTTNVSSFSQHVASNIADPKYVTVTNTTAYRYYAFKFANVFSGTAYMGVRRIELQVDNIVAMPKITMKATNVTSQIWTDGNASNAFKIDVPSTTRLTIDTNGNTGIGTSVPTRTLDVIGTGNFTGTVGLSTTNITGTTTITGALNASGNIGLGTTVPRSLLEVGVGKLNVLTAGNVGINSTVPRQALDVVGSANITGNSTLLGTVTIGTATISNTATIATNVGVGTTLPIARIDTVGVGATSGTNNLRLMNSAKKQLFVVKDDGNIGVGSVAPSSRMDITGIGTTSSSSALNIRNIKSTSLLTVLENGAVGINNSSPSVALVVTPNPTTPGTAISGFTLGSGGTTESTIVTGGKTYRLHKYTVAGNHTFTAPSGNTNIEVLVIAAGGGGHVGGGGAGGVLYDGAYATTSGQTISLSVAPTTAYTDNGANSTFGTLTAIGGGRGANNGHVAGSGGSGGGGCSNGTYGTGGSGTIGPPRQGYNGGTYTALGGAGGGGATGAGSSSYGGQGGPGYTSSITGVSVCYAGGGGGGGNPPGGGATCGGAAGNSSSGAAATANTGGGGGAGYFSEGSGSGGSGVVIIRYEIPSLYTSSIFNGSVGINNQAPNAPLTVNGVGTDSNSSALMVNQANGTTNLIVQDGGNVGLSTSVPVARLDVVGIGTTSSTSNLILRNSDKTALVTVLDNGNVGIGSATPASLLDVKGTAKVQGLDADGNVGISTSGTSCTCTNFKYGLCIAGSCT